MPPNQQSNFDITFLTFLAFFGLLLIAILTAFPPKLSGNVPWRKPFIGSIFSTICGLGVLAALSPTRCLTVFKFKRSETISNSTPGTSVSHTSSSSMQGHHPNCGNFSAHVFRVRDKTFCAACTGLLLGGLLALVGTFLYFFGSWHIGGQNTSVFVVFGILGVGLGFFQFKFSEIIRLLLNTFYVLGSMLILIVIDVLLHSLMFDLFVVSLILFWIFTRISLSQWDHQRICSECKIVGCHLSN